MKRLILYNVSFEVTRRCNMRCSHCMRGEAQNIDMTKDMIDAFFDTKNKDYVLEKIHHILFTGGEPTKNADLIIYTINKIIDEDLPVCHIGMVTNGLLFIPELMDAFNKFNYYRNLKLKAELYRDYIDEQERAEIAYNLNKDYHVSVSFSTDRFHPPISNEIKELYRLQAVGLDINEKELDEGKILKTGRSTAGIELVNKGCAYCSSKGITDDYKEILDCVHITSKGGIHLGGDGSYDYIDSNIIGKVGDVSLFDAIDEYGVSVSSKKYRLK